MPVPSVVTDLSTTASSNSPADTEQRTTADDYIRALSAFVRQNYDTLVGGQFVFPATQNASSNANTLDDYEEGTFTPVDGSGAGLSLTSAAGRYVKIGKIVHFTLVCTYPSTANGADAYVAGLPYTSVTSTTRWGVNVPYTSANTIPSGGLVISNGTSIQLYSGGAAATNSALSLANIYLSGSYEASA